MPGSFLKKIYFGSSFCALLHICLLSQELGKENGEACPELAKDAAVILKGIASLKVVGSTGNGASSLTSSKAVKDIFQNVQQVATSVLTVEQQRNLWSQVHQNKVSPCLLSVTDFACVRFRIYSTLSRSTHGEKQERQFVRFVKCCGVVVQVLAACMSSITGTSSQALASQQGPGTRGANVRITQNAIDLASLSQPAYSSAGIKTEQTVKGSGEQSAGHQDDKQHSQPSKTGEEVDQVSSGGAPLLPPSPSQALITLGASVQGLSPSSASQAVEARADQSNDTVEDPFGPAVFSSDTGSSENTEIPSDDVPCPASSGSLRQQKGLHPPWNLRDEYGQNEVRSLMPL